MRKFPLRLATAMSLVMSLAILGACGKPPLSEVENERIDDAMARVKVEQDRTDRAELVRQAGAAAEAREERLVPATPARSIQPNTPRQHFPADVRAQLPPDQRNPQAVASDVPRS